MFGLFKKKEERREYSGDPFGGGSSGDSIFDQDLNPDEVLDEIDAVLARADHKAEEDRRREEERERKRREKEEEDRCTCF